MNLKVVLQETFVGAYLMNRKVRVAWSDADRNRRLAECCQVSFSQVPDGTAHSIASGFAEGTHWPTGGFNRAGLQNHRDGYCERLGVLSDGGSRSQIPDLCNR